MKLRLIAAAATAAFVLPAAANAFELDYIGARAGTLGVGGEIAFEVNPFLTVRGVAQGGTFSYDDTVDGIEYDGDLKLGSYGIHADFKIIPSLYATVGVYANNNKLDLTARPTGPTEIGGMVYTPQQIGTLTQKTTFEKTVPYLGLGWRTGIGPAEFNLEAGAYMQGAPKVSLTADGSISGNPAFQDDLDREAAEIEDDLKDFKVYPAISAALRFKF